LKYFILRKNIKFDFLISFFTELSFRISEVKSKDKLSFLT